jgi:hypothetical protein
MIFYYIKLNLPNCNLFLWIVSIKLNMNLVVLGGLVVIVLAIGPKVRGFKPGRGRWSLRTIKIRSTTSS